MHIQMASWLHHETRKWGTRDLPPLSSMGDRLWSGRRKARTGSLSIQSIVTLAIVTDVILFIVIHLYFNFGAWLANCLLARGAKSLGHGRLAHKRATPRAIAALSSSFDTDTHTIEN